MKLYTPNREERAFLYQEANDLEPLMRDLGSLTVLVEEMPGQSAKRPQCKYRVTFVLAPESFGMRVQAVDGSLIEAAIAAKTEAQRQLNAIVNSLPRDLNLDPGGTKPPAEFLH